jgi:hypothetical protein
VYVPALNPIPAIVAPAYVVEPLMNEPDVYPVGTNKFLFVKFDNIPKVSPEPDGVPIGPPVPKLVGNVVTPLYTSRKIFVVDPIIQSAFVAPNPALISRVLSNNIKSVVLNEPEPDHTTPPPTCETVTLKSPATADVGVGVGVTEVAVGVGVSVGVSVTDGVGVGVSASGVPVGVSVGVGVGVSVLVGVGVGVSASGVPVGVSVLVGVGVGVGAASITIVNVLAFAPEPQL